MTVVILISTSSKGQFQKSVIQRYLAKLLFVLPTFVQDKNYVTIVHSFSYIYIEYETHFSTLGMKFAPWPRGIV
jgi:hypothetical protein